MQLLLPKSHFDSISLQVMGSPWIVWQGTHCPSLPSGQVWLLILKIFRLIWSFLVLYCDDFESSITTYLDFMTTRFYHQQKHQPQKKTINLQPSINHLGTTIINLPTPHSSRSWKPEIPWKHPSTHNVSRPSVLAVAPCPSPIAPGIWLTSSGGEKVGKAASCN